MLKKIAVILGIIAGAITVGGAAFAYDASKADKERVDILEAYHMLTIDEHKLEHLEGDVRALAIIPESIKKPYQKLQYLELMSRVEGIKRRMNRVN